MASMNYSAALATKKPEPPVMTYASALAAFNAVMAADPRIVALAERRWGDVVYDDEMEEARRAPRAPKKVAASASMRCMASGCSFLTINPCDLDEQGVCASCNASSNGRIQMRAPSEMTMKELEKAQCDLDQERKEAQRDGFDRFRIDNLNAAAQAIREAKDAIVKRLDMNAV
jgi:hypothetical protein